MGRPFGVDPLVVCGLQRQVGYRVSTARANGSTEQRCFVEIMLVDASFMKDRWDDIESALRRSFEDSQSNDEGYTADNPVEFTRSAVEGKMGSGVKHLVAVDETGKVIGGFFCIHTVRKEGQEATDAGWIFAVPELDREPRREMVDTFFERAFRTLRTAGFKRI